MQFQLVEREGEMECGFCTRPAPKGDNRLMAVTGNTQTALFCQDCLIEFTACMGIAMQQACRIAQADETVVH